MPTAAPDAAPVVGAVARWHELLRGDVAAGLDALLADDVFFLSPVVFTPQRGKAITTMYLVAAYGTLGGSGGDGDGSGGGGFRYVREVLGTHDAVLEFETTVDGIHVNGVDMVRVDDEGRIVEFKVMVRPLQAVHKLHEVMRAQLEAMGGPPG